MSALGNWVGKQRREERQDKLNPFKKAALERLGLAFDIKQESWNNFVQKLKGYTSKHEKLPENINDEQFVKEMGVEFCTKLKRLRKTPREIIGEYVNRRVKDSESGKSVKTECPNSLFTQARVDVLTEAGLDWQLSIDQVNKLKEKGLTFPQPAQPAREPVALEKHAWLTMFEALVEFKKEHGHTFVTAFNSSEELHHWVCQQRKKMNQAAKALTGKVPKDKAFNDYQSEMLAGIDFMYLKNDVEWMESYERLAAYRRLFGTVAIPNKFVSFEALQQVKKQCHNMSPLVFLFQKIRSSPIYISCLISHLEVARRQ